jgi:ribosomal protein RSM22 (predicted rRNA methylase)
MRTLNATVSPLLLDTINQLVEREGLPHEMVARTVVELSRLFTKDRTALGRPYLDDPTYTIAYLSYFLPVNLSKIQVLLDEMPLDQPTQRFSVLDLGSGPGTGALAVLDWRRQRNLGSEVSVVAMDSSPSALGHAERLWSQYCRAANVAGGRLWTQQADVEKGAWRIQARHGAPYDLIILANCLNEIHVDAKDPLAARADLISELLSLLAPHGTVMIVEPALRDTSRALHQVRDRLLQEKCCTIYSPCLHENSCPALVHPGDWCHEERVWEPPVSIQEIDEAVGYIKDALKFSYLLLRKDGRTITEHRPDVYRVVSELRVFKGESRVWVCNELGRSEIGRQDRMGSASNEAWDRLERGTIVRLGGLQRKERSALQRVPAEGTVEIVRPV